MNDGHLVRRFRDRGDADAFELLFRQTAPGVRRLARARRVDEADLEDLVQEVFVVVILEIGRFDEGCSFPSWVRGIARNRILTWERRRVQRRVPSDTFDLEPAGCPGELAEAAEVAQMVRRSMSGLPPAYRRAIELHYLENLRAKDIASRLNLPASTVRTHLARGLQLLRQRLPAGWTPAVLCVARLGELGRPSAGSLVRPSLGTGRRVVGGPVRVALGLAIAAGGIGSLAGLEPESVVARDASRPEHVELAGAPPRHFPSRPRSPLSVAAPIAVRGSEAPALSTGVPHAASTATLRVTLVDAGTGQPVPQLAFGLQRHSEQALRGATAFESFTAAVTDRRGVAELRDVAPGPVRLRFSSSIGSAVLDVAPHGGGLERTVLVHGVTTVTGEVRDGAGAPAAGAEIWCFEAVVGSFARPFVGARADSDGSFRIAFAGGAAKTIWARSPGRGISRARLLERGGGWERRVSLVLEPAPASIGGCVLGPEGRPTAGAFVVLHPARAWPSHGWLQECGTAADGSFAFTTLPPGDYALAAVHARDGAAVATVHARAGTSCDLWLDTAGSVRGRLGDRSDAPRPDLWVAVAPTLGRWAHDSLWRWTRSDAEGRFAVRASLSGPSLCLVVDPRTGDLLARDRLDVPKHGETSWLPTVARGAPLAPRSPLDELCAWLHETDRRIVRDADVLAPTGTDAYR